MKVLLTLITAVSSLFAQIFISELERNPIGSESAIPGGKSHEYIELLNLSNDTLTVNEISITDGDVTNNLTVREDSLFLPGTVLLILDPDYFPIEQTVPIEIDSTAIIATIGHTSICGGLTSSDGFIVLHGSDTLTVLSDTPPVPEQKVTFTSFNGTEQDSTTLTPSNYYFTPIWEHTEPSAGSVNGLSQSLFREYQLTTNQLAVVVHPFNEPTSITIIENGRIIHTSTTSSLDTIAEQLQDSLSSLIVRYSNSTETIADTIDISTIRIPQNSVLFTEISPRNSPEWYELYNNSELPMSLKNWSIANSEDTMVIPPITIQPQQHVVISKDELTFFTEERVASDWFSFDNYDDTLFLVSPLGVIDSVRWDYRVYSEWADESLHRIVGTDGFLSTSLIPQDPTMGEPSDVHGSDTKVTLTVPKPLFSPNGDGDDDSLKIIVTHPSYFTATARIFSRDGTETIQFPINNGKAYWNGATQSGTTARRNPYILIVEFFDTINRTTEVLREGVVLWR